MLRPTTCSPVAIPESPGHRQRYCELVRKRYPRRVEAKAMRIVVEQDGDEIVAIKDAVLSQGINYATDEGKPAGALL